MTNKQKAMLEAAISSSYNRVVPDEEIGTAVNQDSYDWMSVRDRFQTLADGLEVPPDSHAALADELREIADWIALFEPTGTIAPHEGREIELVQNGTKPLAVVEQRKQPDVYSDARRNGVAGCYVYVNWHDEETGYEVVIVDHRNVGLVMEYLEALEMPESNAKHRTMGRLFGYSQADIDEFIMNQPPCKCSKCTGGTK